MAEQSQIRQLQTPDRSVDVYPLTVEDAVFDENGVQLPSKLTQIYGDIANVEATTTATRAYSVGDYVVCKGQLYKATAAIAIGGTIIPGTNVTAVKITDEMGSGGGSGGHTILNPAGTAMTQRTNLQFRRSTVTDDATNDRTIVTPDGSADFRDLNLTQSDLSASATYARYPYEYTLAWTGATAGSFVKMQVANADSTEYALPYAAEPFTDSVKLYFANALTAQVHVELYLLSTSEITDSSLLANYYTKAQTDTKLANYYTKTQTDAITGSLSSLETTAKSNLVAATNELKASIDTLPTLVVSVPSFSSLPQTISNASITADMVVTNSVLSNPAAQISDWNIDTAAGSLTISGSISGSTTLTLYLMKSR